MTSSRRSLMYSRKSVGPRNRALRNTRFINFFDKKSKGAGLKENQENFLQNSQLPNKLHKPIIRKFKKRKVYSSFKDNIWGVDLADVQLIGKYNKRN